MDGQHVHSPLCGGAKATVSDGSRYEMPAGFVMNPPQV